MSRYPSPVLDPESIPQVALDTMNDTHREEVELINQLGDLLRQATKGQTNETAITNKLEEWVVHTRQHFDRENQLMEQFGFPAYPMHSGEHQRVLEQIEELQLQWQENKVVNPVAEFIFQDWPQWFNLHVNTMDTITAQFLSQKMGKNSL